MNSKTNTQSRWGWLVQHLAIAWTRFFSKRWALMLAVATSIEMGMVGYYGAGVALAALGASAALFGPIAWATLFVVFLIELNLLALMSRQGVEKVNGKMAKAAKQLDQGVCDDGRLDRVSDASSQPAQPAGASSNELQENHKLYDAMEAGFYVSRAGKAFRHEGALAVAEHIMVFFRENFSDAKDLLDPVHRKALVDDLHVQSILQQVSAQATFPEKDGTWFSAADHQAKYRHRALQLVDAMLDVLQAQLAQQDYTPEAVGKIDAILAWLGKDTQGADEGSSFIWQQHIHAHYLQSKFWKRVAEDMHAKSHHEGTREERKRYAALYKAFDLKYRDAQLALIKYYETEESKAAAQERQFSKKRPWLMGALCMVFPFLIPFVWHNVWHYRSRLYMMRMFAAAVIIPASVFAGGFMGFNLMSQVFGGIVHTAALPVMQYVFAIICALAYFYQLYQTLSIFFMSDAASQWWDSMVDIFNHHRSRPHWYQRWFHASAMIVLTLLFVFLSTLATICTVGEYVKLCQGGTLLKWFATITMFGTEGSYGLIYTAKTSAVVNRQYPRIWNLCRACWHQLRDWWKGPQGEDGKVDVQNRPWAVFGRYLTPGNVLLLIPLAIGHLLDGVNRFIVGSFELMLFVGHAVLLGLQGVDNPHFSEFLSIVFETGNEIVQDAALMFVPDEEHEHGLFGVICHILYAIITFAPALLATMALRFRTDDHKQALYQLVTPFGHQVIVTAYDFRYLWGRYFLEFQPFALPKNLTREGLMRGDDIDHFPQRTFLWWSMKPTDFFYSFAKDTNVEKKSDDASQPAPKVDRLRAIRVAWKVFCALAVIALMGVAIASLWVPVLQGVLPYVMLMEWLFPAFSMPLVVSFACAFAAIDVYLTWKIVPSIAKYIYGLGGRGKYGQHVLKQKVGAFQQAQVLIQGKINALKDQNQDALVARLTACKDTTVPSMIQMLQRESVNAEESGSDAKTQTESDRSVDAIRNTLKAKRYKFESKPSENTRTFLFFQREIQPLLDEVDEVLASATAAK